MQKTGRLRQLRAKQFILLGLLITGLALASCVGELRQSDPDLSKPSAAVPTRLLSVDGATLDVISIDRHNVVYLQTLDLRKVQIDQLMGEFDHRAVKGLYYPSESDESSPFFQRLTVAAVCDRYQAQHPLGIISIINASFFEDYESSTRLSFPIKVNGTLITAGSSPYGPIEEPADSYYRTVQLKALTWDDEKATISDYDPATGYPLNQSSVQNGLVSYAYQDHPAYVLADDPVNRYHVLGVLHGDADGENRLLIATANRTTLQDTAAVLRQRGVTGNIMTIDGGISTYLWSATAGDLVLPQVAEGESVPALPHYLGIRSKTE